MEKMFIFNIPPISQSEIRNRTNFMLYNDKNVLLDRKPNNKISLNNKLEHVISGIKIGYEENKKTSLTAFYQGYNKKLIERFNKVYFTIKTKEKFLLFLKELAKYTFKFPSPKKIARDINADHRTIMK